MIANDREENKREIVDQSEIELKDSSNENYSDEQQQTNRDGNTPNLHRSKNGRNKTSFAF